MAKLILLISFFYVLSGQACLNLTGKLAGSCVYRSPAFGDLNGSIEFDIQQPSCNEITIDGSTLEIPGEFEDTIKDGSVVDHVKLAMSWQDQAQEILNFNYARKINEKDVRVDDVSLSGIFRQMGSKIILQQKGTVDSDPVEIYCELYK